VTKSLRICSFPSAVRVTTIGFFDWPSFAAVVFGSSIGTPVTIRGAATMKMIKSTSITSTMGVMLISAIGR
jgi:hypothetical protein